MAMMRHATAAVRCRGWFTERETCWLRASVANNRWACGAFNVQKKRYIKSPGRPLPCPQLLSIIFFSNTHLLPNNAPTAIYPPLHLFSSRLAT